MENRLAPIYKKIAELVDVGEKPVFAVFDFDNTCIVNDIGDAALAFMTRNNLFRDKNLLPSKLEDYSKAVFENYHKLYDSGQIKEAYEFMAKTLSGFLVDEVNYLVTEVLKSTGENIKPREEIIELMYFLKNKGVGVWIVSASSEILVRQAMKHFNIDANLIGIRNIIVDGIITSELEKPLSIYEGKVDCIKKFVDQNKKPLLGVGDNINDLAMLEYCEIKVVIDRQNDLSKIAKQNNWFLAPFI